MCIGEGRRCRFDSELGLLSIFLACQWTCCRVSRQQTTMPHLTTLCSFLGCDAINMIGTNHAFTSSTLVPTMNKETLELNGCPSQTQTQVILDGKLPEHVDMSIYFFHPFSSKWDVATTQKTISRHFIRG